MLQVELVVFLDGRKAMAFFFIRLWPKGTVSFSGWPKGDAACRAWGISWWPKGDAMAVSLSWGRKAVLWYFAVVMVSAMLRAEPVVIVGRKAIRGACISSRGRKA